MNVDTWDLIEQAFWDGTFDAPITTRRKVLTGLGAGLGLAAGGAANLVGNKKRAIWSEKNTDWSKADPWADNAKKYARLAELGKSRESAGPNTSGAIAPREAARSPAARVAPSVHKSATPHKPKMSGGGMSRRGFLGGKRGGDTALDAFDAPFIGSSRAGQHLGAALRGAGRGAGRAVRRGGGIGGNVGEKIGQRIGRSSYGSKGAKVGGNVGGGIGAAAGGLLDRLGGKKGSPGAKLLGGIGQHYGGKLGRSVASQYGAARGGEKGRGIGGLVGRLAGAAISPVGAARGARQGLERSKAHAGAVRKIGTQAVGRALQGGGGRQIGGGGAQRMLPGRPTGRGTRALPGAR